MFVSKFIKLLGHYIRYPVDILLLPVSILFGYFHGIIKVYAVLTLNVVSGALWSKFYFKNAQPGSVEGVALYPVELALASACVARPGIASLDAFDESISCKPRALHTHYFGSWHG